MIKTPQICLAWCAKWRWDCTKSVTIIYHVMAITPYKSCLGIHLDETYCLSTPFPSLGDEHTSSSLSICRYWFQDPPPPTPADTRICGFLRLAVNPAIQVGMKSQSSLLTGFTSWEYCIFSLRLVQYSGLLVRFILPV